MNLANSLAAKLAEILGYDEERKQVIAYGLGAAIQMLELLGICIVFGLVFNCLLECLTIFLGVGLMRRTTGGAHCTTYMACILTSSLSCCLLALFCRYLLPVYLAKWLYILLGIAPALLLFGIIAWRRVPQASPNKPITRPEKIARLRRQCLFTTLIYTAIALLLIFWAWPNERNISTFGALMCVFYWQSFTLTSWSGRLAIAMDRLFSYETE